MAARDYTVFWAELQKVRPSPPNPTPPQPIHPPHPQALGNHEQWSRRLPLLLSGHDKKKKRKDKGDDKDKEEKEGILLLNLPTKTLALLSSTGGFWRLPMEDAVLDRVQV